MSESILTVTPQEHAVESLLTPDSVRTNLSESILQAFRREVKSYPDVRASGRVGDFARVVIGQASRM